MSPSDTKAPASMSSRLDRNIEALLQRRQEDARSASLEDRIAAKITRFAGSMIFVYIHAAVFSLWILINTGVLAFVPAFDPSLVILAMIASVEAIFISTFVMISQNRMAEADDKRADLNLQISLLAEHETTQILNLLSAIAEKLEVKTVGLEDIEQLKKDVMPEDVLDAMEQKAEAEEKA
jgi:uncharacterized membrane protein